MKKCPTCDKTFEDSMRFCQLDGTELVADEPAFDPYATIVAHQMTAEPDAAASTDNPSQDAESDSINSETISSIPISEPDDVLDLPQNDPLRTMYVSESEMKDVVGANDPESNVVEISPIEEDAGPKPPSFLTPDEPAPPPSPFSVPDNVRDEPDNVLPDIEEFASAPTIADEQTSARAAFDEAATILQPSFNKPFQDSEPAPVAEWTPPPAPDVSWQNKEIGANTPFQPPVSGEAGQSKVLAIVSLVTGILSIFCCSSIFIVG
ncbi:MAG: hypothetical protein ABIV48_07915, partial [Pyrinomonadaceae bacterium]